MKSLVGSAADGPFDKYSFNIDDPVHRQHALRAIMSNTDPTLFASEVRI